MSVEDPTTNEEILAEAKERFKFCIDDEAEIRDEAIDDIEFSLGDMWSEPVRKEREEDGRPCLVINKLNQPLNIVVNEGKQNRPQIKVKPVDDKADVATADVINGILRHIQNQSDAQLAFDNAFEYAVRCGIGYWRIVTEYEHDETFDQTIKIKWIENPMSVYFPSSQCKEPNYRDAPYCFVTDYISKDDAKAEYPDVDFDSWESSAEGDDEWFDSDRGYRIAEYFKVIKTKKVLYMLKDGKLVSELADGDVVEKKRDVMVKSIKWYKMCGMTILDEADFVGKWLPIIPVTGAVVNNNGVRHYISLVRFSKDPSRMYNYWKSCETELIALAPKTPWVGAAGQFEGFENKWADANKKNFPYLEYKSVTAFGQPVAAPQRQQSVQVPSGVVNAIREAADDIKSGTGIYDAGLGAAGAEKSGVAINARKNQGAQSNYHFYDNLANSLEFGGRVIVDMIPEIIDTQRTVRILGEDMAEKVMTVNREYGDVDEKGHLYDLTAGRFDVVVTTGASYQTKREESAQLLVQLIQANPEIAPITADLLADFADAPQDVVERLRKAVPPQFLEDDNEENPIDPRAKQMLEAMQKQMQILEETLNKVVQQLEQAQAQLGDKSAELKTKVYIEEMKIRADLEKAKMQLVAQRESASAGAAPDGGGSVTPESIAELGMFLQATSNRVASLEQMLGAGDDSAEATGEASSE